MNYIDNKWSERPLNLSMIDKITKEIEHSLEEKEREQRLPDNELS